MNDIKFIKAGKNRYIGEFLKELPHNAMLNKVAVGAGATSVALRSVDKMVLCVPFVSLILNKLEWCKQNQIDAIGVYANGENEETIKGFKGNIIIVTWDSLHKVVNQIDPSQWKITIDESHKLIDSGAFRGDAIRNVLDNYKKFKSYCFVTATPVDDEYQLEDLKSIQKYQIVWDNLNPVTVNYMPLKDKLHKYVAVIALSHLQGKSIGNAHVFINSVNGIIGIVKHLIKSEENIKDNIRIVCADNDRNNELLKLRLGLKYKRSENTSPAKKINFYTSTSFEGSDLKDSQGVCYIVTDGSVDHTKINILTTLPQIAGRIRDSIYKNEVTLIYTPNSYYSHTTEAEFKESVKANLKLYNEVVKDFKNVSDATKVEILKGSQNNPYLIEYKGELRLNETAMCNEMYNFRTIHKTYYIVKDETQESFKSIQIKHNEIEYYYQPKKQPSLTGLNKLNIGEQPNFKDLCLEYIELRESPFSIGTDLIESQYPIIRQAYEILGTDKMKALEYRQKDFERELIKVNTLKNNDWKMVQLLDYKIGQWLTSPQIKEDLDKAYQELGIIKNAKGTDLEQYYEIKLHFKTIEGKTIRGYKIINYKVK
ncbi:MAG: DEAD/DEAH box helicase family protein [Bacteroidales bacterium]|nr:DEAD/DEAH box helicase family protein [Bacteroidales bacterium]